VACPGEATEPAERRSGSTDSRLNRRAQHVDVTSRGVPRDVIVTSSPPMSSSMPHLGPTDTIQPSLNHSHRSASVALAGCHGYDDDDAVAMTTRTRCAGRQGRHASMEHCYWSSRRQSLSTGSSNRLIAHFYSFCCYYSVSRLVAPYIR